MKTKFLLGALLLVAFLVSGGDSKGGRGKGGGGGGSRQNYGSATTSRSRVTQSYNAPTPAPLNPGPTPAGSHQQPGAPPIGWNVPPPNSASQSKPMSPGNNPGHPLHPSPPPSAAVPASNNNNNHNPPHQTIIVNSQPQTPNFIPIILPIPSFGGHDHHHHQQSTSNTNVNHTQIIINNYNGTAPVPDNSTSSQNITSTLTDNSTFLQKNITIITISQSSQVKSSSNRLEHCAAPTIFLLILHGLIKAIINQ